MCSLPLEYIPSIFCPSNEVGSAFGGHFGGGPPWVGMIIDSFCKFWSQYSKYILKLIKQSNLVAKGGAKVDITLANKQLNTCDFCCSKLNFIKMWSTINIFIIKKPYDLKYQFLVKEETHSQTLLKK